MKFAHLAALLALAGCGASAGFVPSSAPISPGVPAAIALRAYDGLAGGPCSLSADGILWYSVPAGRFAPIWAAFAQCRGPATLSSNLPVPAAQWSIPRRPTQAIFAAVSLQEEVYLGGMDGIEAIASAHHVPVTWLVGNLAYILMQPAAYQQYHDANGDDVQTRLYPSLESAVTALYPWYTPKVAVLGAGYERNIAGALPIGAFWGITWNSHGTDRTFDTGAPWGTYCADPLSYKRPDPDGDCSLLSIEWSARDLTRAYYSGREDAFSTVPEDLIERAGFDAQSVGPYVRALVDAYAAAAADQPLVLVAEEESANFSGPRDRAVLDALYSEAQATGMARMTLRQVADAARAFSNRPRAVAFPDIDAGNGALMPVRIVGGTIDYHDDSVGMTFEAGRSAPARVFPYALDNASHYNVELTQLAPAQIPRLTLAAMSNGTLALRVTSEIATPYGIAVWSDPQQLGLSGPGVVPAGAAGAVLRFDVPAGTSDHLFPCANCRGWSIPYSP